MSIPQYTTCVDRYKYKGLDITLEMFLAAEALVIGLFVPAALLVSLYLVIEALMKICEYLLHGKLVCLGANHCAIGHVTSFETVAEKKGFDKIDNDFSINILPAPWDLSDFVYDSFEKNYMKVSKDPYQGYLIQEQEDMPFPMKPSDGKKYAPYWTEFPDKSWIDYNSNPYLKGVSFRVPVLHLEIEGERMRTFCNALKWPYNWIPGMDKFCRWKPGGIAIGRFVCSALSTLLAPVILPALAAAWAAGSDDNRDFEGAGSLSRGDQILVTGRWVYDAGHAGYNELHPLFSLQKIENSSITNHSSFPEMYARWCRLVDEVPTNVPVTLMTPRQSALDQAQRQPENRWFFHPLLDGCRNEEEEDDDDDDDDVVIH